MIGPPASICAANVFEHRTAVPSTLPNRTLQVVPSGGSADCCGQSLGDPLGVAEHAGRVGRLVGGDVDERLDADRCAAIQHVQGAPDVGLHRLGGCCLEHVEVLERGGVEDDIRTVLLAYTSNIRWASRMSASTTSSALESAPGRGSTAAARAAPTRHGRA